MKKGGEEMRVHHGHLICRWAAERWPTTWLCNKPRIWKGMERRSPEVQNLAELMALL
jgi:hypothetical protein